jgi:N-acetylneuraminate synthase
MEACILTTAQRRPSEVELRGPVAVSGIQIAGRPITRELAPYLVAELSCNHSGSIDKAKRLIDAAQEAGADAVKLQTYKPADLTSPKHAALWALYEKAHTPRAWHKPLFDHARKAGVTIFSSAFSVDGVKFLADLGAPAIKIASAEMGDRKLIKAAERTGLPLIISTGLADYETIVDLVVSEYIDAIFLHCVAQYPSRVEDANLNAIKTLQERNGGRDVGLSDHTPGYETAIAATALGAVMIEKHFKVDDGCIDAAYSLDPDSFRRMAVAVRAIHKGMGDGQIRPTGQPRQR